MLVSSTHVRPLAAERCSGKHSTWISQLMPAANRPRPRQCTHRFCVKCEDELVATREGIGKCRQRPANFCCSFQIYPPIACGICDDVGYCSQVNGRAGGGLSILPPACCLPKWRLPASCR